MWHTPLCCIPHPPPPLGWVSFAGSASRLPSRHQQQQRWAWNGNIFKMRCDVCVCSVFGNRRVKLSCYLPPSSLLPVSSPQRTYSHLTASGCGQRQSKPSGALHAPRKQLARGQAESDQASQEGNTKCQTLININCKTFLWPRLADFTISQYFGLTFRL